MKNNVEIKIREILEAALHPTSLIIENQSDQHAHHAGSPGTGESHFHLRITAKAFIDMNQLARQRMVYGLLKDYMPSPIHALSLSCQTP